MRIAVVGKGGSGKSVLAGTLARLFARGGRDVLALDSDMMPGLALSLGLGLDPAATLTDAVEKNDRGRWQLRRGVGPVRAVQRYAELAPDGVRYLHAGKVDAAGPSAILASANGFYAIVHRITSSRSFEAWTVIGDLPAGPRQLAYRWAPYAHTFVLMVEPSWKSVLTARRIAAMVRGERGVTVLPVASKVTGDADRRGIEELLGEPTVASIPADVCVRIAERSGVAPLDHAPRSPAMRAIEALAMTLDTHADSHMRAA